MDLADTNLPLQESAAPPLICPACRTDLRRLESGALRCAGCARTFPEVAGIPDLRLSAGPYLSLDEDRAKAERLAGRDELSFAELIEEYWKATPEVPGPLARRYAVSAFDSVRSGAGWVAILGEPAPRESVLDVGCGWGRLTVAVARLGAHVTGVDIALRWLVVARRLCDEQGVVARLVAADGAVLPFRAGSFDRSISVQALEHAEDQRGFLQACLLSVRSGGRVNVVTANRFSVAPDPAVDLLGLGYMPRSVARRYVRRRRQTGYDFVRPLSFGQLRALVGLRSDAISIGPSPLPPLPASPSLGRRYVHALHERLRCRSGPRSLMEHLGPLLEVSGEVGPPEVPQASSAAAAPQDARDHLL